eukprot:m.265363 g.265363  ORF g.265363 m.265363 type:complete len:301 (-) comp16033_c0_seq3:2087-2989(-)
MTRLVQVMMVAIVAGDHRIPIAPGVNMPFVNFGGVPQVDPTNVTDVLASGGRGFDSALTYGDETQIALGRAVKKAVAAGLSRSDIFVTTKIPCCPNNFGNWTEGACPNKHEDPAGDINEDIRLIGGEVDLLLLHWPCTTMDETVAVYTVMEDALMAGKTRAIGVSNFNMTELQELLKRVKVRPSVNQCDHSVGGHKDGHWSFWGADDATFNFCQENGISYSAWSPLGGLTGWNVLNNPTVVNDSIAKHHSVSPAQVALRWLVQQNISVVTAADKHDFIVEDLDLFSFSLTAQEMSALSAV